MTDISGHDQPELHPEFQDTGDRFEIWVGGQRAGFSEYVDQGATRTLPHTEVEPAFQGRGLAGTLIRHALDVSREAGREVLPRCPAVARFIKRHPDYADLVPEDRRGEFGL
jgi:predicted GNAT family acetyltransferase